MSESRSLEDRVRELIVRCLRMKIEPSELGTDALLFGGEYGLDSIDALELVVGLEKEFKVSIKDQKVGEKVLRSVASIASFLREQGV
jgi:acyl carrier protein